MNSLVEKEKCLSDGTDRQSRINQHSSNGIIAQRTKFFNLIYKNNTGYVEIREIDREGKSKQKFFKDIEELNGYIPPKDKNIYFGVYSRKTKRGTKKYCKDTKVLWADFDNMEQLEVEYRIDNAGLPGPSMVINSGHGIHTYWLLDERAGKEAESVLKAIADKTGADSHAAEAARIMRVPDTMNVKGKPVKCEVIEASYDTYKLTDICNALNVSLKEPQTSIYSTKADIDSLISNVYRPCIKSILQGVAEGQRNWALGRLTKYLQIVEGYSRKKALEVILAWNERNKPSKKPNQVKTAFNGYWGGNYKLLGCKINQKGLQANLSEHCNRYDCPINDTIIELELDNTVKYNNRLFNKYKTLTGNDLILYGILLAEPEGLNTIQLKEELFVKHRKGPCMSRPTMNKCIDALKALGLIEVIKKPGRSTFCKAKLQGTFGTGYTLVSNGAINGAIDGRVTPGQFKVYVILLKYAYGKGEAFPGVLTLAKEIGVEHQTISDHFSGLEKARYIKRKYDYNEKGVEVLRLRLLI